MSRRRWRWACLFLAIVAAGGAYAWGGRAIHWTRIPTITVVSEDGDPRREAVREAVAFWNRTFSDLGSPFRLGKVTWVTASVPDSDVRSLGNQARYSPRPFMPESMDRYSGDVLIVLSNATFVSYTAHIGDRVVIAIKNGDSWPLSLPNVLRNVVTHELGHAVGLGHNGDPKLLMCGRPAPCRPDAFESQTSRIYPLSEAERNRLLSFYGKNPLAQEARFIANEAMHLADLLH